MKQSLVRIAASVAVLAVGAQSSAEEFLVKYKSRALVKQLRYQTMSASVGLRMLEEHQPGRYVVVDVNKSVAATTLANLASNPDVEWITPNYKLEAYSAPIDLLTLKNQWAIAKVQAEKAWSRAANKGRKNVTIAVIDTGIDYRHPNLAPNMVPGYDFKGNDSDPMDETGSQNPGHGTHCAGIAAATGLVADGVIGMGPEVSLMPIRFLGADGSGDLNAGIKSIDYAIEKKAQVISASWGAAVPRSQATPLIEAVERADAAGVIFVAAAANDGKSNDTTDVFPANSGTANMISVAASSSDDGKPNWSNYGKASVHLAAPGEKIMSTLPKNSYGELSGTSMATPLVSGLVAFLKAQDPSLTGAQIRALLQTTGSKVSIETACNCRVDAFAAVDHLLQKKPWMVPTAATIAENASLVLNVVNGKAPYKFTSSNPSAVTVDDGGTVVGVAQGTAVITAVDADGNSISSLDFNVGLQSAPPEGPGGECPVGDPAMCQILCGIMPELPFCQ